MVESCDRKADYIIIITFDPFYVDGKCALDAVSAGFVKRIMDRKVGWAFFHTDAPVVE